MKNSTGTVSTVLFLFSLPPIVPSIDQTKTMSSNEKNMSHIFLKRDQIGEISEDMIIKGIMGQQESIIARVYKDNLSRIKNLVWSFKNLQLDVEDIYQDGFTIAIMNIRKGKFRGESSFSTYLNSICRNICLKKLKERSSVEFNIEHEKIEENENHFIIQKVLELRSQLDHKCREIIDLRFTLAGKYNESEPNKCLSFDDIAEHLSITTENARQRFKRCLDGLRKLVVSSNEIKEEFYSI
jgi:RNA polymerase sigma factor (sigma-70 family)